MTGKSNALSRRQLELFLKCPRCFWLERHHGISLPASYPLALNQAMDTLLKQEFDAYRSKGELHPVCADHVACREDGSLDPASCGPLKARLFGDMGRLQEWRNNRRGVRWADPLTGITLFGAIDDLLEFPDGRLAVLDYKSSGASAITVYPSYRFQLEVYNFILEQLGYPTTGQGYLAFFVAVKSKGFGGQLPFQGTVVRVETDSSRVADVFREAVALGETESMPSSGEGCDLCRWFEEAQDAVKSSKLWPAQPGPS